VYHGYLRDKNGNFTYFDVPGAGPFFPQAPSSLIVIPLPLSINLSGTVTGSYFDNTPAALSHCFVRSVDGTITSPIDPQGSTGTTGDTNGINKEGAISGGYYDSNGVLYGFVRDP